MEIREARTEIELKQIFPLMRELRTELTLEQYLHVYSEARARDQYRILAIWDDADKPIAAMGVRILHDFVHGKHLYIDDLVVTLAARSRGTGSKLLKWAEGEAKSQNCQGLRLCTGVENESAIRFYKREGWEPRAFAFKKKAAGH